MNRRHCEQDIMNYAKNYGIREAVEIIPRKPPPQKNDGPLDRIIKYMREKII